MGTHPIIHLTATTMEPGTAYANQEFTSSASAVNWRMKRRGMRWRRANTTAIVALRLAILNAGWGRRYAARLVA